jgi:chemotaxis protein MotD
MMDALSAPPAPAPGPVLQQGGSSASTDQTESGSFSKVLSNSGNQEKDARLRQDGSESASEEADGSDNTQALQSKRPVIDISSTKTATQEDTPVELADISTDELARLLAGARAKTKDVKSEADVAPDLTSATETATKAELAKVLGSHREKKAATDDQATASAASSKETQTDDQDGADLTDVLRLLSGTTAGEGTIDGETKHTEQKVEPVVDHKTEAMLSDALVAASADGKTNSGGENASSDKSFRVVRADGKGEPMILQSDANAAADDTGESASVETITVLDARRFIAPASTTNGASITAAMLGDTEWVSAMSPGSELANAATHSSQGKVVNTLKLQMTPIELGSVTATLRLSGEELSVQLTVDNPAALRQLSNDSSEILKSLRAQGLTVEHVQVNMQVSSADRSADAGQNNLASQQQGQQAFQSGGQASDGRARGESASNNARTSDERIVQQAETPSGNVGSTRPDQLYV